MQAHCQSVLCARMGEVYVHGVALERRNFSRDAATALGHSDQNPNRRLLSIWHALSSLVCWTTGHLRTDDTAPRTNQ